MTSVLKKKVKTEEINMKMTIKLYFLREKNDSIGGGK